MGEVKRYDLKGFGQRMEESPEGDYVRFEDYNALAERWFEFLKDGTAQILELREDIAAKDAEIQKLKAKNAMLNERNDQATQMVCDLAELFNWDCR